MGIDPGFARVGWAIIYELKSKLTPIAYGCIETDKTLPTDQRLLVVFTRLTALITTYSPDCVAIEALFFATNAKTAMAVGEARGVILLAAAKKKLPVVSYTPLTVKRTITGDGKADKGQVELMVKRTLYLKHIPKPDDAADALAIAMTHAYSYKLQRMTA